MTRYASRTTGLKTWSRTWEVQKTPYVRPLPFTYSSREETRYPGRTTNTQVNDACYASTELSSTYGDFALIDEALRVARQRWVDYAKGGASASLGLTIMDWRKSLSMLTNAFNLLKTDNERMHRRYVRNYTSKKTSDLYLEYLFGWVPLFSDIYQACMVLNRPIPAFGAKGKMSLTSAKGLTGGGYRLQRYAEFGCLVGGRVSISNPNLALVNNLGLINPLSILWDKVPYSFIVNWFVPVGAYLNSLTDLVGYDVHDGMTTVFTRVRSSGDVWAQPGPGQNETWLPRTVTRVSVKRTLGIPSATFPSPRMPTADLTKCLISFSLMDQQLRKPLS